MALPTYRVSYTMIGGAGETVGQYNRSYVPGIAVSDNLLTMIPIPVYEGHIFNGWKYSLNGAVYQPTQSFPIRSDAGAETFTSQWYQNTSTVKYDLNEGTGTIPDTVKTHSQTSGTVTVNLSETVPTRSNYTFKCWSLDGVPYNPGNPVNVPYNGSVTVVAEWESILFTSTLIYDTDGHGEITPTTDTHPQASGMVGVRVTDDVPERQYYDFVHWLNEADGETYIHGELVPVPYNGSVTLKAVYQHRTVTVTLVSDYGTLTNSFPWNQGTDLTLPAQTSEPGYVFKGWAETLGGKVRYLDNETIRVETTNINLFAVWNTEFSEEKLLLANGDEISLSDVTFYASDVRTVEIGAGSVDQVLSNIGYAGVQFIPSVTVAKYPLAFGITSADMVSAENPELIITNIVDSNNRLTVKFDAIAGGYKRDSLKLALVDIASMTGFVLSCYLSQETDTTVYTIRLLMSEDDPSPKEYTELVASYRNPYVFTFPEATIEGFSCDWQTLDGLTVYHAGDTLTLTGRYVTPEQTLAFLVKMTALPTKLVFNLQGGRSGPGMLSRVSDTPVTFSVPSTVPLRAGHVFLGWTEYLGSTDLAGSTVTVPAGETRTLYAVWQQNTLEWSAQGELFLPYCGIRIWKNETAYFNATFYQVVEGNGLAVINKAENRPGSAKFTLINEYRVAAKRLLAPTFAQWSDGSTGAIEPGMFVELFNVRTRTRADLVMDGYITTMTPDAETVSFEVADQITMASKSGSFLRRNFRSDDSSTNGYFDMTRDDSNLIKDFSNDGAVLKAFVLDTDPTEKEAGVLDKSQWGRKKCGTVIGTNFKKTLDNTRPRRAIVKVEYDWKQTTKQRDYQDRALTFGVRVRSEVAGEFVHREAKVKKIHTPKGSTSTEYYAGDFTMEIPLTGGPNDRLGNNVSIEVTVKQNFPEGDAYIRSGGGTFVKWVKLVFDTETEVTPAQIITIPNASAEQLADPTARVYVNLQQKGAEVNSLKIMEDMAEAMGWAFPKNVSEEDGATLSIYRVGGAYVQDYIQKLADMTSPRTGARLSYEIRGQSPSLYVGKRYSVSDSPLMTIAYGGDIDTVPEAIPFSACSVGITFKNRPNLVTLKGTCSDGDGSKSVTLTVENPSSTLRRGMLIESIVSDTNASSVGEIGKTAYASLMSAEVDQWEGTVTIPGIVLTMSEGVTARAGSGIPVRLFDSRIHLDTVVRVKQVEYNYNECQTKLTVGNYNAIYSNAIRDANALAVTVSDAVGAVADTTLYDNQSVYVKKDVRWSVESGAKVYARRTDDNAWMDLGAPTIYELPTQEYIDTDGTVKSWTWYLVNVTCKADAVRSTKQEYGINAIRLGNSLVLDIPEKRRPDFFYGQTLSVCAMVRKN